MLKRMCAHGIVAAFVGAGLVGCMPKMDIETLKEMQPKRPAELDRLNVFAGTWESAADMQMTGLDETLSGTGRSTVQWECDGWWMVERAEFEMDELGKMHTLFVWGWDARSKKYRTWWFDNWGGMATGTATYCEKTRTWRFKAKTRGVMGTTRAKGTTRIVDDNNMEWTWNERDGLNIIKLFEGEGSIKRK